MIIINDDNNNNYYNKDILLIICWEKCCWPTKFYRNVEEKAATQLWGDQICVGWKSPGDNWKILESYTV